METISPGQVVGVGASLRLLVPQVPPLTVGSHFEAPFSQQAEYRKAEVELLMCHHPEELGHS